MKGEEKLSDVEKVAKAIVEINVYLASQVSSMDNIQIRFLGGASDPLSKFPSSHSLFHLVDHYHLHWGVWWCIG